jgi:hypothetical protein
MEQWKKEEDEVAETIREMESSLAARKAVVAELEQNSAKMKVDVTEGDLKETNPIMFIVASLYGTMVPDSSVPGGNYDRMVRDLL